MGRVMTKGGGLGSAAALAAVLAMPLGSGARAQSSPWVETQRGAVRLVSAVAAVGRADAVQVGVEMRLQPGWKTYWRVPGESGMPPVFGWDGSENVAGIAVVWPGPARFAIAGMQSYGYADRVIFPVRVALARPGAPVTLHLHLRYAICRDVCVPEEARLLLRLGEGESRPTAHAADIAAFAAAAPQPGARLGWKIAHAAIVAAKAGHPHRHKLVVEAESAAAPFRAPDLVAEGAGGARFGMAAAQIRDDGRRVRFVLPYRNAGGAVRPLRLHLTLIDGTRHGRFETEIAPP